MWWAWRWLPLAWKKGWLSFEGPCILPSFVRIVRCWAHKQDTPASDSDSRRMSYLRVAALGRGNHCSRARTTTDLEEAAAFGL